MLLELDRKEHNREEHDRKELGRRGTKVEHALEPNLGNPLRRKSVRMSTDHSGNLSTAPAAPTTALTTIHPPTKSAAHGLWDVSPPPHVVEKYSLEIGEVESFIAERGFGFLDTPDGRLFFHASGFRIPRMLPSNDQGLPCHEIQLTQVRPLEERLTKIEATAADGQPAPYSKGTPVPIPTLQVKMGIMYRRGERNGRPQALLWCLKSMYMELRDSLQERYLREMESWKRLGRYRLELCEREQGRQFRAHNQAKTFVQEEVVNRTQLFLGTNVDYLKVWFRNCQESYRVSSGNVASNSHRWLELSFQTLNEATMEHGAWEACDNRSMEEFLTAI